MLFMSPLATDRQASEGLPVAYIATLIIKVCVIQGLSGRRFGSSFVSRWLRGIGREESTIPALLRARAAFRTHERLGLQGVHRAPGKLSCFGACVPSLQSLGASQKGGMGDGRCHTGSRQRADE